MSLRTNQCEMTLKCLTFTDCRRLGRTVQREPDWNCNSSKFSHWSQWSHQESKAPGCPDRCWIILCRGCQKSSLRSLQAEPVREVLRLVFHRWALSLWYISCRTSYNLSAVTGNAIVWFLGWYEDNWFETNLEQEGINCTAEEMRVAAEGHLTTEALMWNQDGKRKTISGWVRITAKVWIIFPATSSGWLISLLLDCRWLPRPLGCSTEGRGWSLSWRVSGSTSSLRCCVVPGVGYFPILCTSVCMSNHRIKKIALHDALHGSSRSIFVVRLINKKPLKNF